MIEGSYIWQGRPPRISHYQVFCAILYMLRTGTPWRDLPAGYGTRHLIYLRFKRGSARGLGWHILLTLQRRKQLQLHVVLVDSTTCKVHRHGGGQKGGSTRGTSTARASLSLDEASVCQLATLPAVHRDPFDRMLVCQALEHGLTVVTVDPVFRAYPVPILGHT